MKKYFKLLSAVIASVMLFTACKSANVGKSVAIVNGEDIPYEEYLKKLEVFKFQLDNMYGENIWKEKAPNTDQTILQHFKGEILNKVIEDKIISQEAKKQGITADESKVKEYFEQSKKSIDENETLKKYYEDNKIDDNFINSMIREDVIKMALQDKYAKENGVTQEEVDKYYEEHKSEYSSEKVKASHIIILTTENGKDMSAEKQEEAKKKIDEIYEKIQAGESFEELAKQYSQDGSKNSGGDLGYFSKGEMVKEFSDVAFNMNIGEISKPFKTQFGYHIVKVTDKKSETEEEKAKAKEYIKSILQEQKFSKYIENLKKDSKIEKHEDAIANAEKDIKPAELNKKEETTEQTGEDNNANKGEQQAQTEENKTQDTQKK
ncbi:hypothetical protein HMPREF9628_00512 [Peptoanaerobacter stomatis]|uniref:PpiC domain-containing protein n=2 Tax=Peptoanaerobacter stomatis TaxID=796937 RepID=G9XET4_9FIRM|nr:hypothetical protein HMPREF9628_00512 [Peptoanaerobacter stomatis]